MKQLERRQQRITELRQLLGELAITLNGNILSIGCGCAPETELLASDARYTGVDTDTRYIEWCTHHIKRGDTRFVCDLAQAYLEETASRYDVILLLDIDSNSHADETARLAMKRLTPHGILLISERAHNTRIYGTSLLAHAPLPPHTTHTRPTNYDHHVCIIRAQRNSY